MNPDGVIEAMRGIVLMRDELAHLRSENDDLRRLVAAKEAYANLVTDEKVALEIRCDELARAYEGMTDERSRLAAEMNRRGVPWPEILAVAAGSRGAAVEPVDAAGHATGNTATP